MNKRVVAAVLAGLCLCAWSSRARAVGWDGDDFIITGAPNFPQYIGVFDHDLTFKGYLDTNFLGVAGLDFDAQGRLVVAAGTINPEVRVYDPSGVKVGGFTQANSPMLLGAGDLKVAPNGDYVIGTDVAGAREFAPSGSFVRQYGGGDLRAVTFVPGNRMWAAGAGTIATVFDVSSAAQVGTFTLDQQTMGYSMEYSDVTNTVLIVDHDRDAGGVFERNLSGDLLHEFHVPHGQISSNGATRGPGGDIYGVHGIYAPSYPDLIHWSAGGAVLEERAIWPVQIQTVDILWAGSVPEPGAAGLIMVGMYIFSLRVGRR